MKALIVWCTHRTGFKCPLAACSEITIPGGASWRYAWPGAIAFTFLIQAITGLVLWMHYSPSTQTAWESVYYIQYEVAGGWLLRGVHHYSAQVLVALCVVYVLQLIVTCGYRVPREFIFWSALGMGLIALCGCLTGDLLAWDQNSYWSTNVRTNFLLLLPGIGQHLYKLAVGGTGFGHLTLTRFVALHIGVFSPILLGLLLFHGHVLHRSWKNEADTQTRAAWYWPNQVVRNMLVCAVVAVVIGLLVTRHAIFDGESHEGEHPGSYLGASLGAPADPVNEYAAARPEWSLLGVYQLSHRLAAIKNIKVPQIVPIFILPGLTIGYFFLMPFIGRIKFGAFRLGHLVNLIVTFVVFTGLVWLSVEVIRADAADKRHQKALAAGRDNAARTVELAQSPNGIPVEGALALFNADPLTQGPKLFEQHCVSCHSCTTDGEGFQSKTPSAPNLGDFGSRTWIAGFLDKKRILSDDYYGKTAFKDGDMVDYVKNTLKEVTEELIDDDYDEDVFETLLDALAAEAELDVARDFDQEAETVEGIDEDTLFLFEDFTCTDCHKFYVFGDLGSGPDLTAYGSREWLIEVIRDPAHKRFYGKSNDRMPAYFPNAEKALLTETQIEVLADWLKGRWYVPTSE